MSESGSLPLSFKSKIGESAGPFSEVILAERVAAFRAAVGDTGIQEVPPTYLTTFRECEFDLIAKFGVDLSKVLHAEQEYSFTRPLRVGDKLSYVTKLANVLEKRGSNSLIVFMVIETDFFLDGGKVEGPRIAFSKTTIVVRESLDGRRTP